MADFEVKSSEEIEELSEEDMKTYEADLSVYTEENLAQQLEDQDDPDAEAEVVKDEVVKDEKTEPDTTQDNYKARYEGLTPKLNQQAEEIRSLKQKLETKEPEQEGIVFDPDRHIELLNSDPKQAADYYYDNYIKPKNDAANAISDRENQEKAANELTTSSVTEFSKLKEVVEIMDGKPEIGTEFGDFLIKEVQTPKNGFTVDGLKKAFNWFRHDTVIKETKEQSKRDTIKQLNDANPDVVTLTNAKDSKAAGTNLKKMDRIQAAEYGENLSDEELDKLLDDI